MTLFFLCCLRRRYIPLTQPPPGPPHAPRFAPQMKMDLQLYKAEKKHYLLDFKHLPTSDSERLQTLLPNAGGLAELSAGGKEGAANNGAPVPGRLHTLEFFELCAMVITELGR